MPPRFVEPAEPFGRAVSLRLYEAADAARRLADGEAARSVGADFCEALITLGGPDSHPVELELVPAVSRPVDRDFDPVRFRPEHFAALRAAVDGRREQAKVLAT